MPHLPPRSTMLAGALILALTATVAPAQPRTPDASPASGALTNRLTTAVGKRSFALFVPKSYNRANKAPVLFGFDPGGDGMGPVRAFADAAARYGWIVIGSYDSRNGQYIHDSDAIFADLLRDANARFSIDPQRIYTTGLSGGARVAAHLALSQKPPLAGVILQSANHNPTPLPPGGGKTILIGTTGPKDFNYFEVRRMAATAAVANFRCRLYEHDGGHQWAPSAYNVQAVRYLELLALTDRNQAAAPAAQALFDEEAADAAKLLAQPDHFYDGYLTLKNLADLAKDTPAAKTLAARLAQAETDPRYPAEHAAWQAVQPLELALGRSPNALEPLLALIDGYRQIAPKHPRTTAARHIDLELSTLAQYVQILWKQYTPNAPIETRTHLATLSYRLLPDDPEMALQYARVLGETGQGEFALRILTEAVKRGLKDRGRLLQDPAFARLRASPAFQKLTQ